MLVLGIPKLILLTFVVQHWHALLLDAPAGRTALAVGFCLGWALFVATKCASFYVMALFVFVIPCTRTRDQDKWVIIATLIHAGLFAYGVYKMHEGQKAKDNMAHIGLLVASAIGVAGLAIRRIKEKRY